MKTFQSGGRGGASKEVVNGLMVGCHDSWCFSGLERAGQVIILNSRNKISRNYSLAIRSLIPLVLFRVDREQMGDFIFHVQVVVRLGSAHFGNIYIIVVMKG